MPQKTEVREFTIIAGGIVIAIAFVTLMTTIDKYLGPDATSSRSPNSALPSSDFDSPQVIGNHEQRNCLTINNGSSDNFNPQEPVVLFASDAAIQLGIPNGEGVLVWIHAGCENTVNFGPNFSGLPDLVHNQVDTFCLP